MSPQANELLFTIIFITAAALLFWWLYRKASGRSFQPFADFNTETIECGAGWFIHYHQSGHGPHLVLLHGLGANMHCWRWIIPFLSTRFTVTAIDLPGFGRSSKPLNEHYGLDEQSERLGLFLNRMAIGESYIVGNSMGGNIALWFALKNPERVKGLAVIAPATSRSLIPLDLHRLAWISLPVSWLLTRHAMKWAHGRTVSKTHLVDADRVEETFRTYGRRHEAVRSFLLATAAIRDRRLSVDLKELRKPVLILWGSNDKLVNRKVIDDLESALPQAESEVHMGGGHHLQEDEPEWVAEKLASFFLA